MDEQRFYQRPWFYTFAWLVLGGGVYLWQVRRIWRAWIQLGLVPNPFFIIFDIFLFGLGLLVWLAFFAQFVLPVSTFRDRQKIFDRLRAHMSGGHGPAIFIEDGHPIEHFGEEKKRGPGVLWLDSASAAVTRTATALKQTIGPGVHFTENKEYLAGSVDLHRQVQKLGPREQEDPFAKNDEGQSQEEYDQIQKRRLEVSALTRDGVEVVPTISVVFQIDAEPAKGVNTPGSHFTNLAPYLEDKSKPPEENPVFKAILGEGVNPRALSETSRHVAWNQLPARIAVDLWREYLAKFTLKQLFEEVPSVPPPPSEPVGLIPSETQALYQVSSVSGGGFLAAMLRGVNNRLARWADRCEAGGKEAIRVKQEALRRAGAPLPSAGSREQTALQIINQMVKARMTQDSVVHLNDQGEPDHSIGSVPSKEYEILKGRGLRVHAVSIRGIRLNPSIEEQLIRQWKATWLQNARAEKAQIDRLRSFAEIKADLDGKMEYAVSIGKSLQEEKPEDRQETLRTLLLRSRNELVKNDRFHRRASMEREALEEIIRWVERNGA
jgi:hypothetical protein